jgi:hypothetical protein
MMIAEAQANKDMEDDHRGEHCAVVKGWGCELSASDNPACFLQMSNTRFMGINVLVCLITEIISMDR